MAVKRALKGSANERALSDMNEKEEILWILAENVRHAGSMQQTRAIDLLLAVYFRVTAGLGESSLHHDLPTYDSHVARRRFVHPGIVR